MHQALLIFVALPVVYSICVFGWCYLAEKKPVFSDRNLRSMPSVICGHVAVLLILVMLAEIGFQFYPSFPGWLTDETFRLRGSNHSVFEILCIVSTWVIGAAETRWVYIDRSLDESASNNDPTK
jgi:hypothetical protein